MITPITHNIDITRLLLRSAPIKLMRTLREAKHALENETLRSDAACARN